LRGATVSPRQNASLDLITHLPDLIRFRPDKDDSVIGAGLRQFRRLG
jgi:hypothetical protein